jgi:hypothetical protein
MDSARIEAAMNNLSRHMPRAPAELVDDMAKTVGAVEAERNIRLGKTAQADAERTKDVMQKQHHKGLGK